MNTHTTQSLLPPTLQHRQRSLCEGLGKANFLHPMPATLSGNASHHTCKWSPARRQSLMNKRADRGTGQNKIYNVIVWPSPLIHWICFMFKWKLSSIWSWSYSFSLKGNHRFNKVIFSFFWISLRFTANWQYCINKQPHLQGYNWTIKTREIYSITIACWFLSTTLFFNSWHHN